MAMVGCGDKVEDEREPTPQSCPAKMPEIGSACAFEGTCLYADGALALGGFKCGERELVCRDGEIRDTGMHCDPPMQLVTECPATVPPADTACSGALRCLYDTSGNYDAGEFDCSQQEYVCNDGVMKNSGLHCDPI